MSPVAVSVIVTGAHFVCGFVVLLVAPPSMFRHGAREGRPSANARLLTACMRILSFPLHPLTDRYQGWVGTGFPREHLLILANSAAWGSAAGVIAAAA